MASPQERLTKLREDHPVLDRILRMQDHYGEVKAGQQAGGVTYFAFLSFFPVLALAFFVVGYASYLYPQADDNLTEAVSQLIPKLIGPGEGQISLDDLQTFSGLAAVVGVLGVLYAGSGWVSALRQALTVVFETPEREQPNFVMGKLRDIVTLGVVGLILIVSVAVAGLASGLSTFVLDLVGLDAELAWAVSLLGVVLGLLANVVLFFVMFKLLAETHVPDRSLWSGAVLGAVVFEVLKQFATQLFGLTEGQPAFQAFGIALILLVWINYFSRLVLYAASWAYTTDEAIAMRVAEPADPVQGPPSGPLHVRPVSSAAAAAALDAEPRRWVAPFAAGGAAALALVALLKKRDS